MNMRNSDERLISVVIPAFNAERYLKNAIESALEQTICDLEVLVVDDGSQDGTMQLAESFDGRIRVYRQENAGVAAARNTGIAKARGKWIAFLDADDIWVANKIERQLETCSQYVWSHTDLVHIGEGQDGNIRASHLTPKYSGTVISKLVIDNFIGTSSVMVLREAFMEMGGFDQSLGALEDWEFWLKLANEYEIGYVDEPLVQYRMYSGSTSRRARQVLPYHLEVIRRAFAVGGVGQSVSHLRKRSLATSYTVCSYIAEDAKDLSFAWSCAFRALWNEPMKIWRWRRCIAILLKGIMTPLTNRAGC